MSLCFECSKLPYFEPNCPVCKIHSSLSTEPMIQCDFCFTWTHESCKYLGFSSDDKYFCLKCISKRKKMLSCFASLPKSNLKILKSLNIDATTHSVQKRYENDNNDNNLIISSSPINSFLDYRILQIHDSRKCVLCHKSEDCSCI